jgi:hypothetical protein
MTGGQKEREIVSERGHAMLGTMTGGQQEREIVSERDDASCCRGCEAALNKSLYVAMMGLEGSRERNCTAEMSDSV